MCASETFFLKLSQMESLVGPWQLRPTRTFPSLQICESQSRSGPGQPTFLHPPSHPTHPHTHHPHRHTHTPHTHTQTHSKMCSRQQPSRLMGSMLTRPVPPWRYTGPSLTRTPTKSIVGLDRGAGPTFKDLEGRIMGAAVWCHF